MLSLQALGAPEISPPSLREAATHRGIWIGAAANVGHLQSDPAYGTLLSEQYSLVTAENACKWAGIRPRKEVFDFSSCDKIRNFAHAHSMAFRGHNLCWGQYNPAWLTGGGFTGRQKRELLINHTRTVAGHYQLTGNQPALAWDVVNEAIADNPASGIFKHTDWCASPFAFIKVCSL